MLHFLEPLPERGLKVSNATYKRYWDGNCDSLKLFKKIGLTVEWNASYRFRDTFHAYDYTLVASGAGSVTLSDGIDFTSPVSDCCFNVEGSIFSTTKSISMLGQGASVGTPYISGDTRPGWDLTLASDGLLAVSIGFYPFGARATIAQLQVGFSLNTPTITGDSTPPTSSELIGIGLASGLFGNFVGQGGTPYGACGGVNAEPYVNITPFTLLGSHALDVNLSTDCGTYTATLSAAIS